MNYSFFIQFLVLGVLVYLLAKPFGLYMARIFTFKPCFIDTIFSPIEKIIYFLCRIDPKEEMDWKKYLVSVLVFSFFGFCVFYFVLRFQYYFPFNHEHFLGFSQHAAFNAAANFVANTDWQTYDGETSLSYFSQMMGPIAQNFLSAATGICVLVALIRAFTNKENSNLGNFWVDLVRTNLYILIPASIVLAILYVSQGVIQNFHLYVHFFDVNSGKESVLPMGPVAALEAIKFLGANGGGFFLANSAHPFENPTALTNFLQVFSLLFIPVSLCFTFGSMVKRKKEGRALLFVMLIFFLPAFFVALHYEYTTNPIANSPVFSQLKISEKPQVAPTSKHEKLNLESKKTVSLPDVIVWPSRLGNINGKDLRLGVFGTTAFEMVTTAVSGGAADSSLNDFNPISPMISSIFLALGEVIFGGVGCGIYGLLFYVFIAAFLGALMVGRSPEYLGKKLDVLDIKLSCIVLIALYLAAVFLLMFVTGFAVKYGHNLSIHQFSQFTYDSFSVVNNNGSTMNGFDILPLKLSNYVVGIVVLVMRFILIAIVLAIAGNIATKKIIPRTANTLDTGSVTFIFVVTAFMVVSTFAYFPILMFGSLAEFLI